MKKELTTMQVTTRACKALITTGTMLLLASTNAHALVLLQGEQDFFSPVNPTSGQGPIVGTQDFLNAQGNEPGWANPMGTIPPLADGNDGDGTAAGLFSVSWDLLANEFSANPSATFGDLEPLVSSDDFVEAEIGLFDHDSAASGSQIALFKVTLFDTGNTQIGEYDLTNELVPGALGAGLDDLSEDGQANNRQYQVFRLLLGSNNVGDLGMWGSALVSDFGSAAKATFMLSTNSPGLFEGGFESPGNALGVDYFAIRLSERTVVSPAVPEPSTAILAALGLIGFVGLRRRRR